MNRAFGKVLVQAVCRPGFGAVAYSSGLSSAYPKSRQKIARTLKIGHKAIIGNYSTYFGEGNYSTYFGGSFT